MSEVNDSYEVEEQSTLEHDVVAEPESEEGTGGELFKFGILAVVLLFAVLIIALLRPLIFNRIVPAVMGEGQPVAPLVTGSETETIKPDASEEGPEAIEETNEGEADASEAGGAEETKEDSPIDSTDAAPEPENPEDFPTAVPAQNHTVQAGETLTAIAQRYGVSVQAIVSANNITNPDRVAVGTVLIIPVGQ